MTELFEFVYINIPVVPVAILKPHTADGKASNEGDWMSDVWEKSFQEWLLFEAFLIKLFDEW